MCASALTPDQELVLWLQISGAKDHLDAIVHGSEAVFVSVARLGNFGVSIVLPEVGSIPILHGDHGMVSSGQRFFRPNGVNPFIHRF